MEDYINLGSYQCHIDINIGFLNQSLSIQLCKWYLKEFYAHVREIYDLRLQEEINFIGIGEQKRPKKETNQEQISIIWFWDALIFLNFFNKLMIITQEVSFCFCSLQGR